MATPAVFDPNVHHFGLGLDGANLKGYLISGAYGKQLANPVFSRPSDIGSDDLIGQRSLSNWTVNDFSGGEFQEDWIDPAMFAECVGMLPDQLSRRVRTILPMALQLTSETQASISPVSLEHVNGFLYLIFNNATPQGRIFRYNPANPASSPQKETVSTTYLPAGQLITAASWNFSTERIWLGTNAATPSIETFTWDSTAGAGSRLVHRDTLKGFSSTLVTRVSGIHIFGKLKFAITQGDSGTISAQDDNSHVWLYVSGSGTAVKWQEVGILPGKFVKALTYNNAVYILSRSDNSQTFLSMTQGTQVFPVLTLPYFFRGYDMVEYAGRLYIAGTGLDLDGADHHGELYEVNGASLRLVRTFGPNVNLPTPSTTTAQMNGATGTAPVKRKVDFRGLKALCVAEGLLWMPDVSYTGLEAYDATTDAFYGGPRLNTGDDGGVQFTDLVPFGDSIYAWSNGSTLAKTGFYRTQRRPDSQSAHKPYLITSSFHPEPARPKVWSRFTVLSTQVSPKLYVSKDGGSSWSAAITGTATTTGERIETVFDLIAASVTPSRSIRFKIEFGMTGAANENAAYLIAHSLSFLIRGDTKKRWVMMVNASDTVEDINYNTTYQIPADVVSTLWTLKDNATPIVFRDLDATQYNVVIVDISEQRPAVIPSGEGYINLTLLEV